MIGNNLRILTVLGYPLAQGGHIMSTLAHVKYLKRNGYEIVLVAIDGPKKKDFFDAGCQIHFIPVCQNKYTFLINSLKILYYAIKAKPSVIEAKDYLALKLCILANCLLSTPFVYTKAGGPTPQYSLPKLSAIICYSAELKDYFLEKYKNLRIEFIKERIDLELFHPLKTNPASSINPDLNLRVFISMRLSSQKEKWLDSIMLQIEELANSSYQFEFFIAGSGNLFDEMVIKTNALNKKIANVKINLLGEIADVSRMRDLYQDVDVVLGHGRGIMEAMACRVPSIIIGENMEAEIVASSNFANIAYFNFSGRHFRQTENSRTISETLLQVVTNKSLLGNIANLQYKYITENYNAKSGVEKISIIFENIKNKQKKRFNYIQWGISSLLKSQ